MTVSVAEKEQVSIPGDDANPDSRGFLCIRGNAAHEIVGNDQRLLTPLIRNNPGSDHWQEASWAEAMDLIAARMAAVGLWQGHGNAVNDYGFGLKRSQMERFANLYGCQHWNPAMICWGLGGFGPRHSARSHGAGFADITAADRRRPERYVPNQMEAIIAALESGAVKVLLSLGSNFLSSFPDTNRVRSALAKADLVVAYDIFMNQTTREAAHVGLPGTIWLEEIGAKATNTHV